MKQRMIAALLGISLLLTACQADKKDKTDILIPSQGSQITDSIWSDVDSVQETLISYLNDCWGYREGVHRFVFDAVIELNHGEYSVFKVYSPEDEYLNSFAISLLEKKVYVSDGKGGWIEDINLDPWTKWE